MDEQAELQHLALAAAERDDLPTPRSPISIRRRRYSRPKTLLLAGPLPRWRHTPPSVPPDLVIPPFNPGRPSAAPVRRSPAVPRWGRFFLTTLYLFAVCHPNEVEPICQESAVIDRRRR